MYIGIKECKLSCGDVSVYILVIMSFVVAFRSENIVECKYLSHMLSEASFVNDSKLNCFLVNQCVLIHNFKECVPFHLEA